MKSKYTIIVKDNEKNEVILELGAEKTAFSYSHLESGVKVDIHAEGFLDAKEEKEPKVYVLDEYDEGLDSYFNASTENTKCNHEYIPYQGFSGTVASVFICKFCGSQE